VPLFDYNSNVEIGFAKINLNIQFFNEYLKKLPLNLNSYAIICEKNGNFMGASFEVKFPKGKFLSCLEISNYGINSTLNNYLTISKKPTNFPFKIESNEKYIVNSFSIDIFPYVYDNIEFSIIIFDNLFRIYVKIYILFLFFKFFIIF
jgi:hypothetical protein